ncbi:MAG TPA: hypothetical protein VEY50_08110 [Lysobacter sp.]|nr:hypothetical protein [Lysobacter sp.]
MANPTPVPATRPRRLGIALLLLLVLAVLAVLGWRAWVRYDTRQRAELIGTDQRLGALDARIDGLRRDQRALVQRLQQADATNRVLRDELLGIGQRAALLEETVTRLADPDRHGAQALRLDEAELLLSLALQRAQLGGDVPGALRAYALAAGVLEGVNDPAYLSLRQTLLQERAALETIALAPRVRALAELDAFARTLTAPRAAGAAERAPPQPWWRRAFAGLIDVRPTERTVARDEADRATALAALQLEITLARAAAERSDRDGYRAALVRAEGWLRRLGASEAQRTRLRTLAEAPLALDVPTLGTTLEQLRRMRAR